MTMHYNILNNIVENFNKIFQSIETINVINY